MVFSTFKRFNVLKDLYKTIVGGIDRFFVIIYIPEYDF